jgi:hypothetical protein
LITTKLATITPMAILTPVPRRVPEGNGMYQSGRSPFTASAPWRDARIDHRVRVRTECHCGQLLVAENGLVSHLVHRSSSSLL